MAYTRRVLAKLMLIGVFGACGAIARSLVSPAADRLFAGRFPLGTLVVNVVGCLFAGFVLYFTIDKPSLSPNLRAALMTGFLGGLTTFSAFGFESVLLMKDRQWLPLAISILANVAFGIISVMLGRECARLLSP